MEIGGPPAEFLCCRNCH